MATVRTKNRGLGIGKPNFTKYIVVYPYPSKVRALLLNIQSAPLILSSMLFFNIDGVVIGVVLNVAYQDDIRAIGPLRSGSPHAVGYAAVVLLSCHSNYFCLNTRRTLSIAV